jgi:AAA family ATP:ADP antiporter
MKNAKSIQFKQTLTLCAMGFFLIFGYAFARPCIDSLFLEHYSSNALPHAWLLTAFFGFLVIAFYNRFNQKYAILSLYGRASLVCAAILIILLACYFAGFVPAIFILYIWKELYMVVLMETYWSFADIVFSINTARYTYGLALVVSSVGGIIGNLLVGPFARILGTQVALCAVIFFLLIGVGISYAARSVSDEKPKKPKEGAKVGLGVKALWNSRYLVPLALLVCTVQMVVGLIEYNFKTMLYQEFTNTDLRTLVLGQVHAAVNVISISIQFCTGPILKLLGIGNAFKSIPFVLSVVVSSFVLFPQFALMLGCKISSKALDYSLLRSVKEILYIPLSREEKTQGKGLIDIFMYRLARGLVALMLMGLAAWGLTAYVMHISLVLVVVWLFLAFVIAKRYMTLVKPQDT